MSQHFSVNGKKYLPSNTLAVSLGYTPDYIGRLAREQKILGILIGRSWFIEPTSLEVYLLSVAIAKEIAKEELSRERKKEKIARDVLASEQIQPLSEKKSAPAVFAQALAIVMCGIFVGGLGSVASSLSVTEVASGTRNAASLIASSVVPSDTPWVSSLLSKMFGNIDAEVSQEKIEVQDIFAEREAAEGIYTVLPYFGEREVLAAQDSISEEKEVPTDPLEFSDEVRIVVGNDGVQLIEPVFRKNASTSARFLLVPVTDNQN